MRWRPARCPHRGRCAAARVGYYCGGMNSEAPITVHGSAGPGVGENMMSGTIVVKGDASQYAGATGRAGCWSSRATPRRAAASR